MKEVLILVGIIVVILAIIIVPVVINGNNNSNNTVLENKIEEGNTEMQKINVEMKIEEYGVIKLELYPEIAPITVENFVNLVEDGFYDGVTFHRIIANFMIQGGDPDGDGMGGSDKTIKGEFAANGVENNLSHERGIISMARTMDPNSASSQFFIMHQDSKHLDGSYAAFGKVTSGIEVVDKIATADLAEDSNGTVSRKKQPKIEYVKSID